MDSIPPATTISDSPVCTACAASATAFNPEPQTLLMVIAATCGCKPPRSAACRAGFCPSPAQTTLPMMTSSTCPGSMPARRTLSATTFAPNSLAEKEERPPWNFPTGRRTALRITAGSIGVLLGEKPRSQLLILLPRIARGQFAPPGAAGLCDSHEERWTERPCLHLGRDWAFSAPPLQG